MWNCWILWLKYNGPFKLVFDQFTVLLKLVTSVFWCSRIKIKPFKLWSAHGHITKMLYIKSLSMSDFLFSFLLSLYIKLFYFSNSYRSPQKAYCMLQNKLLEKWGRIKYLTVFEFWTGMSSTVKFPSGNSYLLSSFCVALASAQLRKVS